jgi:hypothetical protein
MTAPAPPPSAPTDARRIAAQLVADPRVTFAAKGFWPETKGAGRGSRAYVDVSPLGRETAARMIDCFRGWAA